ncbi:hypothetical protein HPB49_025329 [Dermacentor silvarum]|uniref:Uncharacterized protein n=1 Tax=Dermacentor silvarum TaxID=543639 RepID=A0ACB8CIF3_DERSI|nr:hypothetical protein HPB49_025329 [Dermacentor silvarum]
MVSEHSRLQQLLDVEKLGDRRPSQLMHRMSQLFGDRTQDSDSPLLRELLLQHLPQKVVPVLAAAEVLSLEKLTELADRVAEFPSRDTAVASTTTVTSYSEALQSRLQEKIDRLTASIAAI